MAKSRFDRESVVKIFRDYCLEKQSRSGMRGPQLQFKIQGNDILLIRMHPPEDHRGLWVEQAIARFVVPSGQKKWRVYTIRDGKRWTADERIAATPDVRDSIRAFDSVQKSA